MKTFSHEFLDRMRAIEAQADTAKISFTQLCREAGVARGTFERWRKGNVPKSIQIMDALSAGVAEANRRRAVKIGEVTRKLRETANA